MGNGNFFDESLEQSQVKATIVAKYFWAWAKVILGALKGSDKKIAYIDLFAGAGRYKDGTKSTPLLILEKAIQDPIMRENLATIFNDVNSDHSRSLEEAIKGLPGIESLKYKPQVFNFEVGTEIVKNFESMKNIVPTLFFVDPWGYKGLSLRLINSVLGNWGCECIIFFNYNRINMGIPNQVVEDHINVLFGPERANNLRVKIGNLCAQERELVIIEELSQALVTLGGKYVLPFRFRNPQGSRTSHHLIFVSKNVKGYEIMKSIMAGVSSTENQGVASFEYNKASERQPLLHELCRPLDELGERLLVEFSGQTLSRKNIYEMHHIGKPFIEANYRAILLKLEREGKIIVTPPAEKRRKLMGEPTMSEKVLITFPIGSR